ncbi:MAG: hypothetical protein FJ086_09060 [Deltaproteobacteria bacterium]|nr:hypothetical protein [Deltaproteobacteria bacterium]
MASIKQKETALLSPAAQAWEAGDMVTARKLASAAVASGATGTAADEAKALLERTRLPPLAWWLAAGVAAAYTALVLLSRTFG